MSNQCSCGTTNDCDDLDISSVATIPKDSIGGYIIIFRFFSLFTFGRLFCLVLVAVCVSSVCWCSASCDLAGNRENDARRRPHGGRSAFVNFGEERRCDAVCTRRERSALFNDTVQQRQSQQYDVGNVSAFDNADVSIRRHLCCSIRQIHKPNMLSVLSLK